MYTIIDEIDCVMYETPSQNRLLLIIEKILDKHSNQYTGKCYASVVKNGENIYKIIRSE